ncbi:MAG: hypothetical protein JKY65_19110 [Planctomycetes bacterium]|nr:hypothetical protein [Planctomycetota bacterium]
MAVSVSGDLSAPRSSDAAELARALLALAAHHADPLPLVEAARVLLRSVEPASPDDGQDKVGELRLLSGGA